MDQERKIFTTNPEKASARVTINSFMMGSLFVILTLIWSLNPGRFSYATIVQLVLAIPLLFVSSLTYAKIGYWQETKLWDTYGWFTNTIGTLFIINVAGLITATLYKNLAIFYFVLTILLMAIYSAVNVVYRPASFKEKLFKFLFLVVIIVLGGLLPVVL